MAFSAEIRARLGLDTTTFNTQLQAVPGSLERMGAKAQGILARTFSFNNIAKGFLSGLGIGSALAVINKISGAISESIEHAGKLSLIFDDIARNARSASEAISRVGKSEGELLEMLGNKLDTLKQKRDALLNDTGSKSFFGGLIEKGSALDKLFGFSRDEEIVRAEKLKQLNQEIGQTVVERVQKKDVVSRKSDEEELRRIREMFTEEEKRAEAVRHLADFEREQRRAKMSDAELINDLERERRAVAQQIGNYEKAQREGIVLSAQGVVELLELKEDQAALEERILKLTTQKVAIEREISDEMKARAKWAGSIDVRGRPTEELTDRELQAKRRNLEQQLLQTQLMDMFPNGLNLFGASLLDSQDVLKGFKQRELSAIQRETELRQRLQRNRSFFGEERAFEMSGLTEQEYAQRTRGLTTDEKIVSSLEKLREQQKRDNQAITETLKSLR
jgi:hypothetical protein